MHHSWMATTTSLGTRILNGLSRLPLKTKERARKRREAQRPPVLGQVHEMVGKGWLTSHVPVLNPFYARRDEIRAHLGCLMQEIRVIVPPKLCPQVLEELHRGHLGVMRMKALPRRYIWWPGIHKEIEEAARTC